MLPLQLRQNSLLYRSGLSQHLIVPKPDNSKSLAREPPGALVIVVRLPLVVSTVNLHDQPLVETNEVDDVPADGNLPAELPARQLTIAKEPP